MGRQAGTSGGRSGPTGRSPRSGALRSRTGCQISRRRSRVRSCFGRWGFSPASSMSPSTIVASRAIRPAMCAVFLVTPGERVYLSHDQVAKLAACSAYPTLVLTLAYTGLRWGEATGLCTRSVNRLRRASSSRERGDDRCEIHVGTPKTHENRSVPYLEVLTPLIDAACDGKGPEVCCSATASITRDNSGRQGLVRDRRPSCSDVRPRSPASLRTIFGIRRHRWRSARAPT